MGEGFTGNEIVSWEENDQYSDFVLAGWVWMSKGSEREKRQIDMPAKRRVGGKKESCFLCLSSI